MPIGSSTVLRCAAVVALFGGSAAAQVQPDDCGDGVSGIAGVLSVGVNECRFDHRSPRAIDVDRWSLPTQAGRVYGVRVELIDSQAEALGRVPPYSSYTGASGGVIRFPISGGSAWFVGEGAAVPLQVTGLAQANGSSARYRMIVVDGGTVQDAEEGAPALLQEGEWRSGTLEPSFVHTVARDEFRFPGVAGRRYRVEVEGDVQSSMSQSAAGTVWPRDGDVVFYVWRGVAAEAAYAPYRARYFDMGPEPADDHGNRPEEATPLEADGAWRFGYSHLTNSESPLMGDWFGLRVVARHAYEVRTRAVAPALNGAFFGVLRDDGLIDYSPMLMAISGHESRVGRFRATEDAVRYFVVPPRSDRFSYEIRAVDLGEVEDDVGDRVSGTGALSVGGSVAGVLEHGADVDAFELVGVGDGGGGRYRVTWTAGNAASGPLRVLVDRLTGSQFVGSSTIAVAPAEFAVDPGTRLRVTVSRTGPGGTPELPPGLGPVSYTLTLSHLGPLPEPLPPLPDDYPDDVAGAPLVAVNQPVFTTRSSPMDFDVVRIALQPGRLYRALSEYAVVRDATGAALTADAPSSAGFASGQFMVPVAGEFSVHGGGGTNLGVEDMGAADDDQATFDPPRRVGVGTWSGRIDYSYDQDRFYVEVDDGTGHEVTIDAPGAGSAVWLQLEPGWNGVSVDDFGVRRLRFTVRSAWVPAGGYDYTVTVRERWREHPSEDQPPASEGGAPLAVGETALVVWRDYLDEDALAIDVAAGHVYRFVLTQDGIDEVFDGLGFFELRNSAGDVIAGGSQVAGGPVRAASDERWMLVARFQQGAVRVRVEDLGVGEDDCGALPVAGGRLHVGEARRGVWEREGDVDGWIVEDGGALNVRIELIPDGGTGTTLGTSAGEFIARPPSSTTAYPRGYWLRAFVVCPGDIARAGASIGSDGYRDANDLVLFIDRFFRRSATADIGGVGGLPVPDGRWDSNDFVVFIEQFFAECG